MLTNIIAVAIGFSLVMLLLSLIVTSLGQATQAVFRLRGRNLRIGIATALASDNTPASQTDLNEASKLMNRCDDTALRWQSDPLSLISRIRGPALSWLDEAGLEKALREKAASINADSGNPLSDSQIDKSVGQVVDRFVRLKTPMQNRFKKIMRGIALIWAVVVAAVFQISTPMLLHELSTDPAYRAQLLAAAPAALEAKRDALSSAEPKNQEELQRQYDAAFAKLESGKEELGLINISPMQHGWSFYTNGVDAFVNILGVLLTTILLTLGAPFWFGTLQTAVKWRDIFAPKPPPEPDDSPKNKKNK